MWGARFNGWWGKTCDFLMMCVYLNEGLWIHFLACLEIPSGNHTVVQFPDVSSYCWWQQNLLFSFSFCSQCSQALTLFLCTQLAHTRCAFRTIGEIVMSGNTIMKGASKLLVVLLFWGPWLATGHATWSQHKSRCDKKMADILLTCTAMIINGLV